MNTISILPEGGESRPTGFRAVCTGRKAAGRTPGEALDALTSQLGAGAAGAAVIVQLFHPDKYFSAEQRERLSALMARWRAARETGGALPAAEQAELERLVEEELQGSAERAEQMSRGLAISQGLRPRRTEEKAGRLRGVPGTGSRRARQFLALYLVLLSNVVVCAALLAVGILDRISILIVIVAADIAINLLFLLSVSRQERSERRLMKRRLAESGVRQDSPEASDDVGGRAEQTGAR